MPLATAEERSHGWCMYFVLNAAVSRGPKQGDCIVRSIVFEHERKRTTAITEAKMTFAADVGMSRLDCRVVIRLGEPDEVIVTTWNRIDRKFGGKDHPEGGVYILGPPFTKGVS